MLEVLTRNRRWLIVRGVAGIIFGVLAFLWPGITLLVLVLLYGAYALVDGVSSLVLALRGRHPPDSKTWAVVAVGVLGIAAGIVTFLWPDITAVALLIVVAAWAIVRGIFEVIAAVRLRKEIEHEWLLGVAGALSTAFGMLLIMQPGAGLLALVWLIAIYAILAGMIYLALGIRLGRFRKRFRHAHGAT